MALPVDHAARNKYILDAASRGALDVSWWPLTVQERGHTIRLLVTARPVRCDGIIFGAGARLAQQCADALGALLVTPKLLDLMYAARDVDVEPMPLLGTSKPGGGVWTDADMMSTEIFEYHTSLVDEAVGSWKMGIVQSCAKPFVIAKAASAQHGVNYGWHLPVGTPSPWRGVSIYPSVTENAMVIQQPSTWHGLDQDDYASGLIAVYGECLVDGLPRKTADVYQDADLAWCVSHEGPLPNVRQPGVDVFQASFLSWLPSGTGLIVGAVGGGMVAGPPGVLAGAIGGLAFDLARGRRI